MTEPDITRLRELYTNAQHDADILNEFPLLLDEIERLRAERDAFVEGALEWITGEGYDSIKDTYECSSLTKGWDTITDLFRSHMADVAKVAKVAK